jgi:capsular polysaccharide biosynthesis protein
MKNKTVIVILVALAVLVGVLYNVVIVVDTYEEWTGQLWGYNYQTGKEYMVEQVVSSKPIEYGYGLRHVHHRKVILKQRLLTGETWREYLYDN